MSVQCLYAARAELAEGPVWHEGYFWWVDIVAGTLNRFDLARGINQSRATGDFLSAAVPDDGGGWILTRRRELARLDWARGELVLWSEPGTAPGDRHRFNDAKCGPDGRLWVGTLSLDGARGECALYRYSGRNQGKLVVPGVSLSNGLAWSADGTRMYHIDTLAGYVQTWRYEPGEGTLHERTVLAQFDPGGGHPDGLCSDVEGHLWVALWGGGCVVRMDWRNGKIMERHRLPVSQVSSCAFGGPDGRTLLITTAWQGMNAAQREAEPLAGSLFALETDTRGVPINLFRQENSEQ